VPTAVAGAPRVERESEATWHEQVRAFKRDLLTTALERSCGNRTHAARALGLERTYLLRLVRELGVTVPPPAGRRGAA
jgi:DNA-binding NtrC family response regulator